MHLYQISISKNCSSEAGILTTTPQLQIMLAVHEVGQSLPAKVQLQPHTTTAGSGSERNHILVLEHQVDISVSSKACIKQR